MVYQDVKFEKENGIAILTFNRPHKMNALSNVIMMSELPSAIEDAARDDNVRVLIITGAGDTAFCAGADVSDQRERLAKGMAGRSPTGISEPIAYNLLPLIKFKKPLIAAVNGVAAAGGLSLALVCDIRIASEKARFGATWPRIGLMPDLGAAFTLPRVVGLSNALSMIFTTDIIDATEAERIGLVSKVVPSDELMPTVKEMAARIAKRAPVPLEFSKKAVYMGLSDTLESTLYFETWGQKVCFGTEDYQEGSQAFLEKREPVFKGK